MFLIHFLRVSMRRKTWGTLFFHVQYNNQHCICFRCFPFGNFWGTFWQFWTSLEKLYLLETTKTPNINNRCRTKTVSVGDSTTVSVSKRSSYSYIPKYQPAMNRMKSPSEVARLLAHEPQQRLSAQEGPGRWLGPGKVRVVVFSVKNMGISIGFTKNTWWKRLFRHLFIIAGIVFWISPSVSGFGMFWVCVKMG